MSEIKYNVQSSTGQAGRGLFIHSNEIHIAEILISVDACQSRLSKEIPDIFLQSTKRTDPSSPYKGLAKRSQPTREMSRDVTYLCVSP